MQTPARKRRRRSLIFAAGFAVLAASQACIAYRAQAYHTIIRYKTGWYTPEAGYFVAFCFFVMALYFGLSAFRRLEQHEHQQGE
jgi:hypothetical protein